MNAHCSERGYTILELLVICGIVTMFAGLAAGAISRSPSPIGRSAMEFRAMVQSARALAISTGGELSTADGTVATQYSGSTVIVKPDGSGGSIARLYQYRPADLRPGLQTDTKTLPLHLSAVAKASVPGKGGSTSFALYFSSSGHVAVSIDSRAVVIGAVVQIEPVCDPSVKPSITLSYGEAARSYAIDCDSASMADDAIVTS